MLKKKSLIFGFCFKIYTKSFISPLINTCECVVPYCCQLGKVLAKQQKRFDLQLSQYTLLKPFIPARGHNKNSLAIRRQ